MGCSMGLYLTRFYGNYVTGAVFDHTSETPGLGAEITQDFFEDRFLGKKINKDGKYVNIEVKKPGSPKSDYHVDGISGGTFTSVGVEDMRNALEVYYNYIKDINNQKETTSSDELANS